MTTLPVRPPVGAVSGFQSRQQSASSGRLTRWLWIWITLGILVVVVVIGFLIGISSALSSIDDGLFEASASVSNVEGEVGPLPQYLQTINGSLVDIDGALKPINGQTDKIIGALTSIDGSLAKVDASLKNTSGSLRTTSASLADTSGILVSASGSVRQISGSLSDTSNILRNVLGVAGRIDATLETAERPESLGTAEIPRRVAAANAVLGPIQADTSNISSALVGVNRNLTAICTSPLLTVLGALTNPRC